MLLFSRRWLWRAALAACLAALPLAAQVTEVGAFAGSVRDEQGRPLAGAAILFRSLDFEFQRETRTDKDGRFYYGGFRPGRYQMTILRDQQVVWSFPVTLPFFQTLELNIDLKKLREAAERRQRLDPELERERQADLQRRTREERFAGYLNRGARAVREGRPEEAIPEYQAALAIQPDRGVLYALLAAATAAAGRRDEAMELYRRALQLEPNEAAHHNNLGTLLARAGRLEEALAAFEKAAQLDPDRAATYHFNRGAALLNAGRVGEALPALQQATRSDPTLAVAHYFLGLALFRTSPRHSSGPGPERVEPRPGTIEAFQRYLQLAPDGEYAPQARDYLQQLGLVPLAQHPPAFVTGKSV